METIFKYTLAYLLTAIVFFAVDILWLGFLAKDLYNKYLGDLMADKVNWTAAIIFYLIFIIGISVFAIYPAVDKNSVGQAILLGALFGFFTYATYDLTNLATLKGWPLNIVLIDITWGVVLTAIVSTAGFYITKWIH
ncbi:MAG: DUF2177 family protein [Bacteroidetes bacterium]|nr:MAG: DUF2177 family protein [Bacteroidota bacterium]